MSASAAGVAAARRATGATTAVEPLAPGVQSVERVGGALRAMGGDLPQALVDRGLGVGQQGPSRRGQVVVRRGAGRRASVTRCTSPRATSPSTTPVTLGRLTASFSARADAASLPSASRMSTRYWGRVKSTVASASSTWRASRATTRPGLGGCW